MHPWISLHCPIPSCRLNSTQWSRRMSTHATGVPPATRHPSGDKRKMFKKTLIAVGLSIFAARLHGRHRGHRLRQDRKADGQRRRQAHQDLQLRLPGSASSTTSASTRRCCRASKRKPGSPSTRSTLKRRASTAASAANSSPCASSRTRPRGVSVESKDSSLQEGQGRRLRRLSQEGRTLDLGRSRLPQDHDRRHGHQRR